ncbi:phage tail tape measure protein [Brevundimonas sp.]|uniref:phage tail tape measure protein n=1 Tax=Brevundimonas sp. TaxID=1871086 RepID=UPI0028A00481|nr:phage tail tape measure protein [Brevundimonas sp.]
MSRNLRLQMIMDAGGNATRFLKGVRGETDATSKALRAARERVTELQRASKDVAAYRQMTDKVAQTRKALAEARTEAARLAQAHKAAENPSRQLTRAFELQREKVKSLKAAEEGRRRSLQDIRARLDQAGISTKNLAGAEAKLAHDTRAANQALGQQREKLKALEDRQHRMQAARATYDRTQQFAGTAAGAGASAIGAGMAAASPLIAASGFAINFQDAMLDVKKVVDFDTPQQFAEMNRDVLQLSKDLALPAEGVAQIVAAAGQAKIPREELRGFAKDAGEMGVAFNTTTEDAGKKMATWRVAFNMTQPAVRGLADKINYLGDNGNATALAISDVVTRVGPLAGVAGAAASEVAALGSTIVGMGVAEEIAATGIKNTMLALTKGEAATKAQQKAYTALGLEAVDVAKRMQMDAGGTIVDVLERVSKLSPDRQASILTQLFGSESVAAIAPMLSQLDVLKTNLGAVADSQKTAGSMSVEFANRMSGAKGAIDQATEGLKGSAIAAGESFLPVIREVALFVGRLSERLTAFAQAHPGVIKVAGVLLAIVSGALLVFGGLALAVAAVLGPFALLQFALTGAGALFAPLLAGLGGAIASTWAFTAALLANPITWIVVGIVALAAAAFLIYKNWGAISTWWAGIWTRIKEIGGAALQFLTGLFVNFSPAGLLRTAFSFVWPYLQSLGPRFMEIGGAAFRLFTSLFLNFSPAGLLIRAFSAVWPYLQSLGPRFLEFGGHLVRGIINGVLGGIPALVRAVMTAGGRLITGFKERLGIRSPSRVFAQLGDDTIAGLTRGLDRSAGDAVSSVARVGAGMTAALALGAGTPAIAFDDGPRIGATQPATASAPPPRAPFGGNVTINIYPREGQSAREIAQEVADILNDGGNGSYEDEGEGFD